MAVCPDCNVDVGSGKELTAHRKKKHGVQQVICPYCVGVNKHSNPSALARHVKDKHPTAKVELFGSRLAYYFAVRPEAYRSITQPETITDKALMAKETLERWASQTGGEAAEDIFVNAKQDWRKNMRTVEQGADIEPSSKRPAKATSVPMAVPENEQLSLLTLNLGSRRSLAEIGWYGHGIYRVELGVGDVRSLARKLMELKEPKRVLLGQPCQEARDRATLKVIASVLGIASYKSIKRACLHSQAAVRVNSMGQKATDAEWGNVRGEPSLIPAHPDLDSDDDTEEWSGDISPVSPVDEAVVPPSQTQPCEMVSVPTAAPVDEPSSTPTTVPLVPFNSELSPVLAKSPPSLPVSQPSPVLFSSPPATPGRVPAPALVSSLSDVPADKPSPAPAAVVTLASKPTTAPASGPVLTEEAAHSVAPVALKCQVDLNDEPVPGVSGVPSNPAAYLGVATPEYQPTVTRQVLQSVPKAPLAPKIQTLTSKGKRPVAHPPMPLADVDLLRRGNWPLLLPGRRDWSTRRMEIEIPATTIQWPPANFHKMSPDQRTFALTVVAAMMAQQDEQPGNFVMRPPTSLIEDYNFLALPGTTIKQEGPLTKARRTLHNTLRDTFCLGDDAEHSAVIGMLSANPSLRPPARRALLEQVDAHQVPVLPYVRHQELEMPGYDPCKPAL